MPTPKANSLMTRDKRMRLTLNCNASRKSRPPDWRFPTLYIRHGIDSERVAYEIEAALIDAYPGLTNKVKGPGSKSFGLRHAEEIIREYEAEPFRVSHYLILISMGVRFGYEDFSIYEAVRCAWKVNKRRAEECEVVLARKGKLIVGVFRPTKWIEATHANFPKELESDIPGKWGFVGENAGPEVEKMYLHKRVPDQFLAKKGAQTPFRYCDPNRA